MTFLGTGTSVGVPVVGCECPVCVSTDPRNKRFRSSVVVRTPEVTLLVDSGPDLRMQSLRENLRSVDAVLYTHAHLDHVVGFDELRAFCWRREDPLPLYATRSCMDVLQQMFGWAFAPENVARGYVRPAAMIVEGPLRFGALTVTPLPVVHGAVETIGYHFDIPGSRKVAYIPDVKCIPEETLEFLQGVDVLVVDSLRHAEHPNHFSLREALAAAEQSGARETWLTHMTHDFDAEALQESLPPGVHAAWDGLRILL